MPTGGTPTHLELAHDIPMQNYHEAEKAVDILNEITNLRNARKRVLYDRTECRRRRRPDPETGDRTLYIDAPGIHLRRYCRRSKALFRRPWCIHTEFVFKNDWELHKVGIDNLQDIGTLGISRFYQDLEHMNLRHEEINLHELAAWIHGSPIENRHREELIVNTWRRTWDVWTAFDLQAWFRSMARQIRKRPGVKNRWQTLLIDSRRISEIRRRLIKPIEPRPGGTLINVPERSPQTQCTRGFARFNYKPFSTSNHSIKNQNSNLYGRAPKGAFPSGTAKERTLYQKTLFGPWQTVQNPVHEHRHRQMHLQF